MEATGAAGPPAPFAVLRRYRRGDLVVQAHADAWAVYWLRSGQVRVFSLTPDAQEITIALLGPGQLAGIAPLLGRPVYHASVEALTEVELWVMPADRVLERVTQDAEFRDLVATALARRLALAQTLLRDVSLLPVPERIQDVLSQVRACVAEGLPQLTHELLASLVGARRETVTRALGRLDGKGTHGGRGAAHLVSP